MKPGSPAPSGTALLLALLSLATETMLAHPEALPADLIAMLGTFAADLTNAQNGDGSAKAE